MRRKLCAHNHCEALHCGRLAQRACVGLDRQSKWTDGHFSSHRQRSTEIHATGHEEKSRHYRIMIVLIVNLELLLFLCWLAPSSFFDLLKRKITIISSTIIIKYGIIIFICKSMILLTILFKLNCFLFVDVYQ